MPKKSLRVMTLALIMITVLVAAIPVMAGSPSCETQVNDTQSKLLACVTVEGVREHQAAFQAIADANGGNRAGNSPGYLASVDYVVEKMTAAGYNVTLNGFPYSFFPPVVLQQTAPIVASYESGAFEGSGDGSVSASITPVDLNLVPPYDPVTSGCEATDFAGFPAGNIALIQRGTCTFAQKVENAEAAGAAAVIIFNQGNTPDREVLFIGTLLPYVASIPVVGASFADGQALAQPGSEATITVEPMQTTTLYNVIAESTTGDPKNVVMSGAHLDSVPAGPGINDNGSGSATMLEVAEQMSKVQPKNKLRFAWWGAEEEGLFGSIAYVNGLTREQRSAIALYLNFDMVGSPNYVFFIYDGDNSDGVGAGPGPKGSDKIEKRFERYFNSVGQPFLGTDFDARSDYFAFVEVGIPSGGLFTGAEGIKTAAQAAIWGGTAGEQYDPCYHLACDGYDNASLTALDVNSDAVAYTVLFYSKDVSELKPKHGRTDGPIAPFVDERRAR
jgi:Zn-dependent M28 family amino/carboxypeptidase